MDRSKSILSASALALYAHFALQLVAGVLLSTAYGPERAHAATAALHRGGWAAVQGFHYWGSAVMIVHSVLHLAAVTWAGWYKGPQVRAYLAAIALAGLSLAFQLTGNALSGDRHGVQTAAIEGSIAARVPGVGPAVSKLMLGGDVASPGTVALWYNLHRFALPVALVIALWLGLGRLSKPLSPPGERGRGEGPVAVFHQVETESPLTPCPSPPEGRGEPGGWKASWPVLAPALLALVLAFAVPAPFGSIAAPGDYETFDAKPSWYTAPMHGLLVWGGWVGSMVVPALFALALLLLPALRPKLPVARGLLLAIGALLLASALFAGGESASLVGTRDPAPLEVAPVQKVVQKQDAKLAARGRTLFAGQGCNNCHGKDGLKGMGGPSLANVWKVHPDADYYVRYIRAPQSVKKGSTMPAYPNLKPDELAAMAEFLRFAR